MNEHPPTATSLAAANAAALTVDDMQLLAANRRSVVAAALLCGGAGLLPVPLLGTLIAGALRRALVARLAHRHRVTLEPSAVGIIASAGGPSSAGLIAGIDPRALRRSLLLVLRMDEASRTFLLGTHLDYYLYRHHSGHELDVASAVELARALGDARARVPYDLVTAMLSHAMATALRAGLALPRALLDLARSTAGGAETTTTERVLELSLMTRAIRLADRELAGVWRSLVAAICRSLDEALPVHPA